MKLSSMCVGAALPAGLLRLGVREGVGGSSARPFGYFLTQTLYGSLGWQQPAYGVRTFLSWPAIVAVRFVSLGRTLKPSSRSALEWKVLAQIS